MSETTLERQRRVMAVFDAVIDLVGETREQRLHALCGDDAGLLADVRAMLDADARAGAGRRAFPARQRNNRSLCG